MRLILLLSILCFSFQSNANQEGEYLVKINTNYIQNYQTVLSRHHEKVNKNTILLNLTTEQVKELKAQPEVLTVAKNIKLSLLKTPDDLSGKLWGLNNERKNSESFDINAPAAWDITTGSKEIVVAVIDTGAYVDHDDLMDNLWENEAELNGVAGEDDDGNGYIDDVFGYDFPKKTGILGDRVGHGTHVSGTIGAKGNNNSGIVGVNWDVSIMTLNMFPDRGAATLDDALKAIEYAVNNGANVINASWGGPAADPNDKEEVEAYVLLEEAIKAAGEAGVIFVAAAGNSGQDSDRTPLFPAAFELDSIVSVGSMKKSGRASFFSNYGKTSVDVFAPGSDIVSTTKNGRTGSMSGTSMASPHVAGIAALMLSANPDASISELKAALIETCTPNQALKSKSVCQGHVDTHAAILKILPEEENESPE